MSKRIYNCILNIVKSIFLFLFRLSNYHKKATLQAIITSETLAQESKSRSVSHSLAQLYNSFWLLVSLSRS